MGFGREILSGQSFEDLKSQIDQAAPVDDLAKVVASVQHPSDREKVLYAAERRVQLMLKTRIQELSNSN